MNDYAVVRPAPDLPEGFLPPEMDGKWFDRAQMLMREPSDMVDKKFDGTWGQAVATPTGRFEVRDGGAVAEVFEVGP